MFIDTPLKNSANNLEGSLIAIFLFLIERFFLIGFILIIIILAIRAPQKTSLLTGDHAICPMHHPKVIDLKI